MSEYIEFKQEGGFTLESTSDLTVTSSEYPFVISDFVISDYKQYSVDPDKINTLEDVIAIIRAVPL